MTAISQNLWKIVRDANFPKMRRIAPVGLTHNGGLRRVAECACCGASISWCSKWREPKRVTEFYKRHNSVAHVLAHIELPGTLAGTIVGMVRP